MTRLSAHIPDSKWQAWKAQTRRNRVLLCMAWICDNLKPREKGSNRGEIIDAMTRDAGYPLGSAWCAISIAAAGLACGYTGEELPYGWGAVRNWVKWAENNALWRSAPQRTRLAYWLHDNGTGHIGIVYRAFGGLVWTIEGNTSSGSSGNQREGDGMYRRVRLSKTWHGFIALPD